MTLIIEDGTGVANSNSYVTDLEYTDYATTRGLTVGSDETAREKELILANDFLESMRASYQGNKTLQANSLQFPRCGVFIDGFSVDDDVIPQELKNAQMEAGAYANANDLITNTASQNVSSEKVDVIEISYFSGGKTGSGALDRINVWLRPLLKLNSNGRILTRV